MTKSTTVAITEWLDLILSNCNNEIKDSFFIDTMLIHEIFNYSHSNSKIENRSVFIRYLKQIIKKHTRFKFIKHVDLERVNRKRRT